MEMLFLLQGEPLPNAVSSIQAVAIRPESEETG